VEEIYQDIAESLLINQYLITYDSGLTVSIPVDLTIAVPNYLGLSDSDTRQFTSCP